MTTNANTDKQLISPEEIIRVARDMAELAMCDMSGMDGREHETMWANGTDFDAFAVSFYRAAYAAGLEAGAERCEQFDNGRHANYADLCAAALREMAHNVKENT